MRVRVIAGKYGGRMLDAPRGRTTHPMGERIRGAMFNGLMSELPGASVLDAYAGTGAIGLEALSRGAQAVEAVEYSRLAQKVISRNVELLGLEDDDSYRLYRGRMASYISNHPDAKFDIIFVDPPYYEINQHLSTIERLFGLLKPTGLMVLSKPGNSESLVQPNGIVVVDNRSYGDAHLIYYRQRGA